VQPADVVWSYSGVRPLLDDDSGSASAVTRDYLLEFDEASPDSAPLLTVWGGKLTTFRKLAEEVSAKLLRRLGESRPAWTGKTYFPGGDFADYIGAPTRPDTDLRRFIEAVAKRHPELPAALRERWAHAYGSRIPLLLAGGKGLGVEVAPGLHEAELDYLHQHEWARSADDVLWRRSKLGLHYSAAQREAVARWWAARHPQLLTATTATAATAATTTR